jgi:transposase
MTQNYSDLDFLPLKVVSVGRDGKRRFDKRDRKRLIEACLQPGVSVAGMALRAGVNANLLRRWICEHQKEHRDTRATQVSGDAAAFVPVFESAGVEPQPQLPRLPPPHRETPRVAQRPAAPSRLTVEMRNGVTLRLECGAQDATLVSAMIETLGRCDVPAGR